MSKKQVIEIVGIGFGVGTTVAIVLVWLFATFQSRAEALDMKTSLELRNQELTEELAGMRSSLDKIQTDLSYIKGKIGIALGGKDAR